MYPLEETTPARDNGYDIQTRVQVDKKWRNLPARVSQAALDHVEVYLNDLIGVIQGGQRNLKI